MNRGIFVAGTGTDVGKTYISALLVKSLREQGVNAGYFKAALSGARREGDVLIPGDAEEAWRLGHLPGKPQDYVTYCYETAVSPHLASLMEGPLIEPEKVKEHFEAVRSRFDYIVAEGCGGIFCPLRLSPQVLLTDIIGLLPYDILMVAPSGLGSINAAVLAVEYARQKGLHVSTIVMNGFEADNFLHQDNKKQMEHFTGLPVFPVAQDAKELNARAILGL